MLKSSVQSRILKTLPDDRPITAIQVVQDLEKCPRGFYPVSKTYDQDCEADLGEKSIFKSSTERYLCLSKTKGIPNFFIQEIIVLNEKNLPPKGFSALHRTADSQQRAWKKKNLYYRLVHQKELTTAITDIIVCSRVKRAPDGFALAGEINGVTVCYKMGNAESTQNSPPDRPRKPLSPASNVYPSLGNNDDYEILRPPSYPSSGPSRPAPKPPGSNPTHPALQHQTSTLGSHLYAGLEGVPFTVNPKFLINSSSDARFQSPKIKTKTMQQILNEYDYPFTIERQAQ